MKKKIFITGKTRTIKDHILEFFDYIELVFFLLEEILLFCINKQYWVQYGI